MATSTVISRSNAKTHPENTSVSPLPSPRPRSSLTPVVHEYARREDATQMRNKRVSAPTRSPTWTVTRALALHRLDYVGRLATYYGKLLTATILHRASSTVHVHRGRSLPPGALAYARLASPPSLSLPPSRSLYVHVRDAFAAIDRVPAVISARYTP